MKTIEWTDCTSYRRGEERNPRSWEAKAGTLSIKVVFGHLHHPKSWVMHCYKMGLDTERLEATTEDDAKIEALAIVRNTLRSWLRELI